VTGVADPPVQPRTVLLRRSALYEVQALWPRSGEETALDAWLHSSERAARERGGEVLMILAATKALFGDYVPPRFRIVAWPDEAAFAAARGDEVGVLPEQALADATVTLTRPHPEIHAYPEEFDVELDARLCYEISAFWDRPAAPRADWDAFITAVTPSIRAHGGHPLLVFEPLRQLRGDFFPNRLCIAAWDTQAHFEGFVAAPEHAEISRLRWRAVERMDASAARLIA
jgi:uncharacterized protein (DUF1330 family)